MRVFLSAGEASGDAYGAALIGEIQRLGPLLTREQFVEIVTSSVRWPLIPSGPTPSASTKKERADFYEIVGYDLDEVVPSDLDVDSVLTLPWAEVPDALYLLAKAASGNLSTVRFEGLGGPRMRNAGMRIVADTSRWGAISIVHSLKVWPRTLSGYYEAKRRLAQDAPGLFVPIDFGYANIRLARHAKNRGWKVLYFVPPGSWRRDRQGRDLPAITDAISTPFEWSAKILRDMGAHAHWFGHPIKQLLKGGTGVPTVGLQGILPRDSGAERDAPHTHGRDARATLGVLPGSRKHELDENVPIIAEAIRGLPNMVLEFALAPTVDPEAFARRWQELAPDRKGDVFTQSDTVGVLRRARAAIVCSGTATLEAALCRCPMVVVYRISRAMVIEAKILRIKRPKFIALPNILLDRLAIPELVHDEATPEAIRGHLETLLADTEARRAQLADFEVLDQMLGEDQAITRTAELALGLVGPESSPNR